jgi:hypothetical protein
VLQCASGEKFSGSADLSASDSDDPPAVRELPDFVVSRFRSLVFGNVLSPPGPGRLGRFFAFLPQPIRDHLQDRYWTALTP